MQNFLRKETPTIAEFFKKNGYSTYYSGKWHLGDKPEAYPIEHGFDEMKAFAAYYPGVYTYADTSSGFIHGSLHTTPSSEGILRNREHVRVGGRGRSTREEGRVYHWDYLATFDVRQADSRSITSRNTPRTTSRSSWTSTS